MNFDDVHIETYIEDWLKEARKNNDKEVRSVLEISPFNVPLAGIPLPVTETIFFVSRCFNLDPQAKFLAVHIFDKFMGNAFWENLQRSEEADDKHLSRVQLSLLSSIQLASKVDLRSTSLTMSQVQVVLQALEPQKLYSFLEILMSELRVLKTLDWRIPTNTPINYIDILLAVLGLRCLPNIQNVITWLLDVVYLKHDQLYARLQIQAQKRKQRINKQHRFVLKANSLFLAASVILCAMFFLDVDKKTMKNVNYELGSVTNMVEEDIKDLAELLFETVMEKES